MRYRLIIFDFDGTLADSAEWFLRVMNELADEFRFQRIEPDDRELLRRLSSAEVLKFLKVPMWKLPRIMSRMRTRAAQDAGEIHLFGGVEAMLRGLEEAGACLGVVSSNSEENIRTILGPRNAGRIRHFSCGATLFGKTSKLKSVLRRSGFGPGEALYIGDEIRDAVAVRAVPMAFGAVGWGYTHLEALRAEKPALIFERMEEIVPAICAN